MGLLSKHHSELNKMNVQDGRYDELREEYKGNSAALQQIDVYDSKTVYHSKLKELRDALEAGDAAKERELGQWFAENYPDV